MTEIGAASEKTAAQTERAFRRQQAALASTSRAMQGVGRTMTYMGAGMLGVGYVGAKAAIGFEASMARLHTQAQVSTKDVALLSNAVLKLGGSGQVQFGPEKLAQALYHVESVAVGGTIPGLKKTGAAMNVLKIAAQGAAVGGSDLEATTTALMGAMTTLHAPASDAYRVMGLLNATVGAGNMRMEDLVQAMGRGVIPAFRNVGLTATDAMAAIALVADQGTNASSAAAQLATSLHYLASPTTKASKELAYLGLQPNKLSQDLAGPKGLYTALVDIRSVLKGMPKWEQGKVIFDLLPGGRGRILQQILNNLDQYKKKLGAVYDPTVSFGESIKAQQNTMSGKLHTAWAKINTDLVKFGITLIPIIDKYLPLVMHDLESVFNWLTKLNPHLKSFLAKAAVAMIIGGPLLLFLGKLVGLYKDLRGAFMAIKGAGMAAAAGEGLAAGGLNLMAAAFRRILPLMAAYAAYKLFRKVEKAQAQHKAGKTIGGWALGGATVGAGAGMIAGMIGGPPGAAVGAGIGGGVGAIAGTAVGAMHALGILHTGGYIGHKGIRRYGTGGFIGGSGSDNQLGLLQVGEGVLNRTAMSGIGVKGLNAMNRGDFGSLLNGLQIQSTPVYVVLDGRVVAQSVLKHTLRKAARGPSSLVGGQLVTNVRGATG